MKYCHTDLYTKCNKIKKLIIIYHFQILNIGPSAGSSNGDAGSAKPKHNSVPLPSTAAQLTLAGKHVTVGPS
jgi:hypothetical protein